jgi:alpha-glucosidase
MGVSGVPFTGMDIGGFMGNPSPELFIRWMSLGIYSPLFRNHTHIGYNYREPWLFGEYNTDALRKILEQRYKMLPYLYSTFYTAHTTGMPINRMLPIAYTYDENVYSNKFENQFLFGDNMLVCPVESNKQTLEVYLPGNIKWYRFSNDELFAGGKSYYVPAPLNDVPVFVKEGAIIPMQSVVQHTKEKGDGILYLHIWKGDSTTTFTYYEDDGETYGYEKGEYYKRTITIKGKEKEILFSAVEGNYKSKFEKIKVIFHGFQTSSITLPDRRVNGTDSYIEKIDLANTRTQMNLKWH